jgi:hypothetical protein
MIQLKGQKNILGDINADISALEGVVCVNLAPKFENI